MANYCSRCGRPLQNGELCSCQITADIQQSQDTQPAWQQEQPQTRPYQPPVQQEQPLVVPPQQTLPYTQPVKAPAKPNAFLKYLELLWECLKAYLKDAPNTLRLAAAHKDIKTGFTYAGIYSVLIGLFLMASCHSLSVILTRGITTVTGYFSSIFKISGLNDAYVGMPYGLIFLFAFLLNVAFYFAICAMGLLLGRAMGKKPSFQALMASMGVSALPAAILTAASILCSFLWLPLGLLLAAAALFTWVIGTYTAIKVTLDVTDSKLSIYYGLLTAVVIGIVLLIGVRFAPSLLGQITVSGESLNDILSSI